MEAAPNALIRLNLGCGLQAPPGWINVDGSWNARLAKFPGLRKIFAAVHVLSPDKAAIPWSSSIYIHDIRKPLPFANGSASAVFASHVLEHLYRDEGQQLIRESRRVLCPGGILRLIVPDLEAIVQEYYAERPPNQLSGEQQSAADVLGAVERLAVGIDVVSIDVAIEAEFPVACSDINSVCGGCTHCCQRCGD